MITLESGGKSHSKKMENGGKSHSKKIAYSISKISIPQNESKQTGPYENRFPKEETFYSAGPSQQTHAYRI
jgi:hypothetical protein